MKLCDYLKGLESANTADELESAIHAPFKHAYWGATWTRICKARIKRGAEICVSDPLGRFVPRMEGRELIMCGQSYKVGRGQNGSGLRYAWHSAGTFAKSAMMDNGLTQRAAHRVWDTWTSYPHRCLAIISASQRGDLADPAMNILIAAGDGGRPINMTVERNNADEMDRRATMVCCCGGSLFDWGCGFADGFTFINWHCNACPQVFTEYVTRDRMAQIRQPRILSGLPIKVN
jgi:hypothetical protein